MNIKILLSESAKDLGLPTYATIGSVGMDLKANIKNHLLLEPSEIKIIPTGVFIELAQSFEAQIRSRSGLASKSGVAVLNSPGTIDSDYRGEIKVILINHSSNVFKISRGDKIAQMVICKYERVNVVEVDTISNTERGSKGFGSTGF